MTRMSPKRTKLEWVVIVSWCICVGAMFLALVYQVATVRHAWWLP